ncbi:TetR family transcriptional regulator [Herbaspirillum sp. HC18]|nr:TetR family transcriptional regulator [Herbaspirillum sp. HC18]
MARNTKEEALETRNRILDAAENVFHARGVAQTSLADIAEAAGVTRGAIYWHFKNKSDLFDAMCERVRLPMEAMMEAATGAGESDPLGNLYTTCVFILTETARNPRSRKVFEIMFHKCEYVEDADPISMRVKAATLKGNTNIERALHDAVARGQLPPDLDTRLACVALHAQLSGILNNWLFLPDRFDLAANAERLMEVCFDCLRYAPALRKG